MSVRSKEIGGYVCVKCKQKRVNGRQSEQKNLMSHMKCKQKGVNGRLSHTQHEHKHTYTIMLSLGKDVEGPSPNLSVVWVWSVTSSKMLNWFN